MPLQVVGVGYGRTGTDSLRVALEQLGYPCYHMITAGKIDDYKKWVVADKQIRETGETSKLREIFENPERNWRASVDFPTCVYWRELLKEYPNAKFILGVRDPEKWYASARKTIWHPWAFEWSPFMTLSSTIRDLQSLRNSYHARVQNRPYDDIVKQGGPREVWDKEKMIKCFNDHIEDCKKNIPKDQLLVFKVTDGWEPLCKFLGHEVPAEPFPNVNDTAQFSKDVRASNVIGGVAWVIFLGIIGGTCYLPFGLAKFFGAF